MHQCILVRVISLKRARYGIARLMDQCTWSLVPGLEPGHGRTANVTLREMRSHGIRFERARRLAEKPL
jgi:hypothetical protein